MAISDSTRTRARKSRAGVPLTPKKAYSNQLSMARKRGIEWLLTFDEWWEIWAQSGKWEQRGRHKGGYVMARYGDVGPYSRENVRIITNKENCLEARAHAQRHGSRAGVYFSSPGSTKPWAAFFANKRLGQFATEAEARAAREAAVAERIGQRGRLHGGWKWAPENRAAVCERNAVARMQVEESLMALGDDPAKQCPGCGKVKPLRGFFRHSTRADGYQRLCKLCQHEYRVTRRLARKGTP